MLYKSDYLSPLGKLDILCDEKTVKGIWFENQSYHGSQYDLSVINSGSNQVTKWVKKWLEQYFAGKNPEVDQSFLAPEVTEFRKKVLEILEGVPYGQTITYKEIADKIFNRENGKKSSARAVGGAVGHNPITILIPCHRVVGTDGSLTGYAGGMNRKIALLALEGVERKKLENIRS